MNEAACRFLACLVFGSVAPFLSSVVEVTQGRGCLQACAGNQILEQESTKAHTRGLLLESIQLFEQYGIDRLIGVHDIRQQGTLAPHQSMQSSNVAGRRGNQKLEQLLDTDWWGNAA